MLNFYKRDTQVVLKTDDRLIERPSHLIMQKVSMIIVASRIEPMTITQTTKVSFKFSSVDEELPPRQRKTRNVQFFVE